MRLASLDALRGFDLFLLVALGPVVLALTAAADTPALQWLADTFTHKDWEGFSLWDLVMPLFVFMSGASIPFALSRYRKENDWKNFSARLIRRVALLWLFGLVLQGNLLALNPDRIYLFSNTLQSIAVGYAFGALLFMTTRIHTQILAFVLLLLSFWAAMTFITVDGFGGGSYAPDSNLAEWVDRMVLGRFRDGAWVNENGKVVFSPWYRYTWVLSSLGFSATALSGLIAGTFAKSKMVAKNKLIFFLACGAGLLVLGYAFSFSVPVIKKLWTPTMVLVASGWSFLLLGLFYLYYDILGKRTGLEFLKVYGMNSITAYMIAELFNFRSLAHTLLFGLEQFLGAWYPLLLTCSQAAIVFAILWAMKRCNVYLKV